MPEMTISGRSGSRRPKASFTQSVGVPKIPVPVKSGSTISIERTGSKTVRECPTPDCWRMGATTHTVWPASRRAAYRARRPGARMPSSLVSRTFI